MDKNKNLIIKETFDLAVKNHQKNNLKVAQGLYNQVLEIDPQQANAHNNLGGIFQSLNENHKAQSCYEKAIEIDPNYAQAHCNLGVIFQSLNENHKAQSCYEKAIEIDPNISQAHNNLASIFQKFREHQKAIVCYENAIKANPDYEGAHSNLGALFHELGEHQKAITYYGKAILLNNNNLAAINGLVLLLPLIPTSVHLKKLLLFLFRKNNIDPNDLTDRTKLLLLSNSDRNHLLKAIETESLLLTNDFIKNLLKEELFHLMLQKSLIADRFIEKLLTKLRSEILFTLNDPIQNILNENFDFIISLAEQTWLNEYVYIHSKKEINDIKKLKKKIENDDNINELEISILATYIPLNTSKIITKKLLDFKSKNFLFNDLINLQIKEPLKEKQLLKTIESLDVIDDSVSKKVQEQYEEHPYPRWRCANKFEKFYFSDAINFAIKPNKIDHDSKFDNPNVLVAGCGTGRHPINATKYKNANILAVDLSLTSLAYAKRKTEDLGYKNIKYLHADILQLKKLNKKFDIIESVGTIHHMKDPIKGLKVLLDILEPHGFLKLGLYSETARLHIVKVREFIKSKNYKNTSEDIKICRQEIFNQKKDLLMHKFSHSVDFYSTSAVRDLVFHIQEHRFTIPQISKILKDLDLEFLGFSLTNSTSKTNYSKLFPNDRKNISLDNWHQFEINNPDTFRAMYQFWVKKN